MLRFRNMLSYYDPRATQHYIYMLQLTEYDPAKFWGWLAKEPNLNKIAKRGNLVWTKKAKALALVSYGVYLLSLAAIIALLVNEEWMAAVLVFTAQPLLVVFTLASLVWVGAKLLNLARWPLLGQTKTKLQNHKAVKIAVLGSYGKTTMKELLSTVLGEANKVKATPGNMNVPISHARWVTSRVGKDEDFLIFEYGEGKPGDIRRFAELTSPNYAMVTGLAPNHLDHYRSLEALKADLLSIRQFVDDGRIYLNLEARALANEAPRTLTYSGKGIGKWKISNVKIDYDGTNFVMKREKNTLNIKSGLLGKHQVGPLAAVAALAYELGLNKKQIEVGLTKTKPFEHRMQPRYLHGAWIIDDTYNGNLEGVRAGLQLMGDLPAKRKIYVTPGLVDQGVETERVHQEIGRLIGRAKPDKVVLMQNSVTGFIQQGLAKTGYAGEIVLEDDPLNYYTNLDHTLAAGDLAVLQNDWTDNYQ